jgi:hypothetical protein
LIKAVDRAGEQVERMMKDVGDGSVPHLTEHLAAFKNSLTMLSSSAQSIRSSSSPMKLGTGTSHNFISSACQHCCVRQVAQCQADGSGCAQEAAEWRQRSDDFG